MFARKLKNRAYPMSSYRSSSERKLFEPVSEPTWTTSIIVNWKLAQSNSSPHLPRSTHPLTITFLLLVTDGPSLWRLWLRGMFIGCWLKPSIHRIPHLTIPRHEKGKKMWVWWVVPSGLPMAFMLSIIPHWYYHFRPVMLERQGVAVIVSFHHRT